MFIPLQQLECSFALTSHLLAGLQICVVRACEFQSSDHSAAEVQGTAHRHERDAWKFSHVENVVGGDVCAAAPGLGRFSFTAGPAQRAGRGGGQTGFPNSGAVTELQTAGTNPARTTWRSRRYEEAPPQQAESGGRPGRKPRQGHADADDILRSSCKNLNACTWAILRD